MYNWFIENKELLKILYALLIGLICFIIVIKTNKLFKISFHQGIRYFRNAFFFYGIAFIARYFLVALINYGILDQLYRSISIIFFEFFLIMGGFFLLYSLLWRNFEYSETSSSSSLFNSRISLFYIMAFILVFLDYIWGTLCFMFFSQILLFVFVSIIAFMNYKKNGKNHKFLKFYFLAMLLNLVAWSLNTLAALFLNYNQKIMINIYVINVIIFLLFLYGIIKFTRL